MRLPSFTVSPTALQFIVPRDAPATLTVTSKTANTIAAASSSASCLVSPASVALTKPRMGDYVGTFTVTPSAVATGPGTCTITLTDKKGGQTPVVATLVASQVRLRQATLATGTSHSCALDAAGAAWCWGFNQYGSLGDGTTTNRSTPVAVSGGLTFASLTAGALTTCGLTSAGVGYCWGAGGSGQIGDGGLVDRTAPAPIAGGLTFAQVTAGGLRTCGLTPAGKAYCWGRNLEGQVGDGTTSETRPVPTAVANAIGGSALVFASLEAGGAHACGLTSVGKAYCWGYNENGQVGDGTTNIQLIAPKAVNTNLAFTELTARNSSTCGLSGGALYCWGYNGAGQLGDGTTTQHRSPSPATGGPFATLAAGGTPDPTAIGIHVCALTGTGAAYCWGRNGAGQLGDGTNTDHSVPTAVTGPGGGAALAFASLSTGYTHTCGRTTGNALYCWGFDNVGELGNGSGDDQNTPTLVILGGRPTITSVVPSSSTIAVESSIPYDATLFNPGNSTLTGVGVQGYIIQGTVTKPAGGTIIECSGTFDALLPPGSCTSSADLTVSNSLGGPEPLVPGPATYQLDLYVGTTIVDSETVPITLE